MPIIEDNMAKHLKWCHEVPFYTLGTLTTDPAGAGPTATTTSPAASARQ